MTTTAILRFGTLVMAAYGFLDEQHTRLSTQQAHVTIGQAPTPFSALYDTLVRNKKAQR